MGPKKHLATTQKPFFSAVCNPDYLGRLSSIPGHFWADGKLVVGVVDVAATVGCCRFIWPALAPQTGLGVTGKRHTWQKIIPIQGDTSGCSLGFIEFDLVYTVYTITKI